MEVFRTEIARGCQALPILDGKHTAAKLHRPRASQALQRTVNSHDGHAQGFADLRLAERRGTGISFCDAARASPGLRPPKVTWLNERICERDLA